MADRKRRRSRAEAEREPSRAGRFFRRLLAWLFGLLLLAALFIALAVGFAARTLPSYSELRATQTGQPIVVRARDGSEILELGPSYGEWLSSGEIPKVMKDAMIAVEDRRYFSHFGIDPIGIGRAIWLTVSGENRRLQATSTITQQLARNLFLNSNRTVDRKLREAVLAMALEAKFSKQQILELYLNKVYFGGGAYGVDSAARRFFSHPATDLSVGEAAIIAGLVKAPSRYSPTADVDAAVDRANVVLRLMREQGRISAGMAAVDPATVQLKPNMGANAVRYFTDWALPQLDLLLPETFEPIEVWTTIDPRLQDEAIAALKRHAPGGAQGALVSLDRDGAVLALVGGTDYMESNFNRATVAQRQPGSAWKLFVYLAALEAGYTPEDRVVDTPVTIDGWSPRNSGGGYAGEMSLRRSFALSRNTVAAQLGYESGFGTVASMARRFGITSEISTFPSMVLGSSEVRLIDLTRAFAGVAAGGLSVEPYGILKVTTGEGALLYARDETSATKLVPDYVAAGMTDMLQAAVATGTGRAAAIGRPVAGKTGTTSSNKDGWFVGFSSGITTGVWMGRDDARAVPGLQGGRAPAAAFASFMREAVKDRPVQEFDTEFALPDWQLEPDDEYYYGDPDDYYYIDEGGGLIQPGRDDRLEDAPRPGGEGAGTGPGRDQPRRPRPPEPPPAVTEDFLDRALGRDDPPPAAAPPRPAVRPAPPPRPRPTQQTAPEG